MQVVSFEGKNKSDAGNGFIILVSKGRKIAYKRNGVISEWTKTIKNKSIYKPNHKCASHDVSIIMDYGTQIQLVRKHEWSTSYSDGVFSSSNIWDFYERYKK